MACDVPPESDSQPSMPDLQEHTKSRADLKDELHQFRSDCTALRIALSNLVDDSNPQTRRMARRVLKNTHNATLR